MKKRGQFYLLAALVIVGIIISLASVINAAHVSIEDPTVYNLANEIKFEANQAIDNGVRKELLNSQIFTNIKILADYYAAENPNIDFIIIYGDEIELTLVQYKNTNAESIEVSVGEQIIEFEETAESSVTSPTGAIKVTISDSVYNLAPQEGKTFFAILKKEGDDGRFIALPGAANA